MFPLSSNSESLNFLEPKGPPQACDEVALALGVIFISLHMRAYSEKCGNSNSFLLLPVIDVCIT
jgi:hypothetical protein